MYLKKLVVLQTRTKVVQSCGKLLAPLDIQFAIYYYLSSSWQVRGHEA